MTNVIFDLQKKFQEDDLFLKGGTRDLKICTNFQFWHFLKKNLYGPYSHMFNQLKCLVLIMGAKTKA